MVVLNSSGKHAYTIAIQESKYSVCADTKEDAIDIVAQYLVSHNLSHLYYEREWIETIVSASENKKFSDYVDGFGLTDCPKHGICIKIKSVEVKI